MPDPVYNFLLAFYRSVYGTHLDHYRDAQGSRVFVNNRYNKMKTITIMGQLYRSKEARSRRGVHAQVLYEAEDRGEPIAWLCEIQYFFRHELKIDAQLKEHVFAFVRWHSIYSSNESLFVDEYLKTWRSHFLAEDMHCIVPIHRLYSQVAVVKYGDQTHANGRTVVIPLPKKMLA
ncbi:hypothetical protein BDB00DRAFT_852124 [Zychaea mexicana]|uniref:uncharacterized protein n=1 Tax=Zychaea mexicana TaxID=64656 RepID=UPI0022FF156E|nr:uncharacterized protein BDB00DRAFT_852124 [Zychaea mexicana]KAI9485000.1 hypothetical protein BDB00DRAFT_852124 [Zychaea mexicana]